MLRRPTTFALLIWMLGCLYTLGLCYKVAKFYKLETEDIFYTFREGQSILHRQNPYARIHQSDMLHNDKYATYLPGGYYISAAMQAAGLTRFTPWLRYWRKATFVFHVGSALLLFLLLYDVRRSLALCVLGVTIFLFNRWSLFVLYVSHLDTLALFAFLAGMVLRHRKPPAAWVCFGISLAIKQMAIFAVPLLLIDAWQNASGERAERWRETVKATLLIGLVPLLVCAPFLLLDPVGLIKSVLFSVTREPSHHMIAPALLDSMGLTGSVARLPMLVLFAALYAVAWKARLPLSAGLALHFMIFVYFSPVLFQQYILWQVPFVLLTLAMAWDGKRMIGGLAADKSAALTNQR
jgi:uncharacterized membrane protein